jgi:hypothetical protein
MVVAFVQDAKNNNSASATLVVTISPAAGNTLVVQSGVAGAQTITGITDNTGLNTYIKAAGVTNTVTAEVWTAINIVAGVTSVTITYSASTNGNAALVSEYSGVQKIGTNNTNTGAASTPETISITTTGPSSFVVAALANNLGSTETVTSNTGTLRDSSASGSGANTVQTAAVDNTSVAQASVTDSANLTAGVNWAAAAVELQPLFYTTLQVQSRNSTSGTGTLTGVGHSQFFGATRVTARTAGTFSKLYARISTNTANNTNTIRFQKNSANGNQVISFAAAATGEFQDLVNTDSVNGTTDIINLLTSSTGTGSYTSSVVTIQFAASALAVEWPFGANTTTISANNVTKYHALDGSPGGTVSALTVAYRMKTTSTFKNLKINIPTNSRTTTTTVGFMINQVAGQEIISISSGTTGLFEDTTHTDLVISNQFVCYYSIWGAEATTLTTNYFGTEFTDSNGNFYFLSVSGSGTINSAVTNYYGLSGSLPQLFTTESSVQCLAQLAMMLRNLELRILPTNNGITATSTFRFRKNGANGNQLISLPSATAGYFEDMTNTDSVVATDEINYQLITGGTGTNMIINSVGMLANVGPNGTAGAAPTTFQHFLSDVGIGN